MCSDLFGPVYYVEGSHEQVISGYPMQSLPFAAVSSKVFREVVCHAWEMEAQHWFRYTLSYSSPIKGDMLIHKHQLQEHNPV